MTFSQIEFNQLTYLILVKRNGREENELCLFVILIIKYLYSFYVLNEAIIIPFCPSKMN